MKAREIFFKTLPFCWAKLGLGMLNILIDAFIYASGTQYKNHLQFILYSLRTISQIQRTL